MPIVTKRWDDPREATDGYRVLVTRYRPRGLRKEEETWDEWIAGLGPSKELHAGAYGKGHVPITWETYRRMYLKEMAGSVEAQGHIAALAKRAAAGETICLLCSSQCVREARCHRSLLKELIEQAVGGASTSS